MTEWKWSAILIGDGHRFKDGLWRCADCLRSVYDLLRDRPFCYSPIHGKYLFINGPLDGQWVELDYPPPPTWTVPLTMAPPVLYAAAELTYETVVYVLRQHRLGKGQMYVLDA